MIQLLPQVYELMGVDTEKEMDMVTKKVDRVFKVRDVIVIVIIIKMYVYTCV